ncbi:MAG: hypothetical protein Kow0065_01140 [Methylomicrobium sp.]
MRFYGFIVCLVLLTIIHFSLAWMINRPQFAGPDAPSGKLNSLSFAPFREGFSPLEEKFPLPEHIEEDLRLLADKTESIRTYASLGGMETVPESARRYGLTMTQGAWLGYGYQDNRLEIEALIKSAKAHPDVVKRVIVGNEVLLRGEMTPERLISYIREVKKAVDQPVSYADVWSMYMKYPQIIREVDFITIHILPYWEDEPVSVQTAIEHVERVYRQVRQEADAIAPGKPILIGESGWPGFGRQRGGAVPGIVNEALFVRSLVRIAHDNGFDYNIVEAFNQPWKSELEGAVGANWGLYSATRQQVFPLTGSVIERPDWMQRFWYSSAIGYLLALFYYRRLKMLKWSKMTLLAALILVLAVAFYLPIEELWQTAYSGSRRIYVLTIAMINLLTAVLLLERAIQMLSEKPAAMRVARDLDRLYLLMMGVALYKTYGLAMNGRYLDFPNAEFALPVVGILGLALCHVLSTKRVLPVPAVCELFGVSRSLIPPRVSAGLLLFAAIGLLVGETNAFMVGRDFIAAYPDIGQRLPKAVYYTLINRQLLLWLGCLTLLAFFYWRCNIHGAAVSEEP